MFSLPYKKIPVSIKLAVSQWRKKLMSQTLAHSDIWDLPKTDLHRHIDGSIRPEVLFKLAKEVGVKLPTDNLQEFIKLYQITDKDMSVDDMLRRFGWAIAVMRSQRGLYRVAKEHVHDLKRENIWYSEPRLAPGYLGIYPPPWYVPEEYEIEPFKPMSLEEVTKQTLKGLQSGMKDTGVTVNLINSIARESLTVYGPQSVTDIVDLSIRFQNEGVVAIGLDCNELVYPTKPYGKYFRKTLGTKIRRNPHAGEMGGDEQRLESIGDAITGLSADGLAHAIPLHKSKYWMAIARGSNIRVERTPLSPVPGCSLADGHLDVLLEHKVPVVITSDDPALMKKSLTDNWEAALNYHDYGEEEYWQMTANALNTAFYRDQAQKEKVQAEFIKRGLSRSLLKP